MPGAGAGSFTGSTPRRPAAAPSAQKRPPASPTLTSGAQPPLPPGLALPPGRPPPWEASGGCAFGAETAAGFAGPSDPVNEPESEPEPEDAGRGRGLVHGLDPSPTGGSAFGAETAAGFADIDIGGSAPDTPRHSPTARASAALGGIRRLRLRRRNGRRL